MPDIEPVESGDRGVSGWTVFAVVVGAVVLLGVSAWFLIRNLTDDGSAATSDPVASPSTVTDATVPGPLTITGRFVIESDFDSATAVLFRPGGELVDGTLCEGSDGVVEPGTKLTVTDENGTLLGTGVLDTGVLALAPNADESTVPRGSSSQRKDYVYANSDCVLEFTIPLSKEAEFYTVAVGSLGGRTYSRSDTYSHVELASFGWVLDLVP